MPGNLYLSRYAYPRDFIESPPARQLGMVVVVPAFHEENLLITLKHLSRITRPSCAVETIVVINEPEECPPEISEINQRALEACREWSSEINITEFAFHPLYAKGLPAKSHGVGLARKIGMDEAVRRFDHIGNHHEGIIIGLDADCTCQENYFLEIQQFFEGHPDCPGVSIHFEHPLEDTRDEFEKDGIVQYEMHLRYLVNALRFTGFPFAFHTIGSAMAVRSSAYMKQGGMNQRRAGEDFYFLNRIMQLGNFCDLSTTTVFPSPRKSSRVPFGTGKAMQDWGTRKAGPLLTYPAEAYMELKEFLQLLPGFYQKGLEMDQLPAGVRSFLSSGSDDWVKDLRSRTRSLKSFTRRFYEHFDGFKVVKYLNYYVKYIGSKIPVNEAVIRLWTQFFDGEPTPENRSNEYLLDNLRELDRSSGYIR